MSELSYIEHLNIPVKYKGTILHAYEYNMTVDKINEIVDNLHTTYDYNKNFPRFDSVDNIFASTGSGNPVIINNNTGKLYPVTSSAYVLTGVGKTLDDDLNTLNSQLESSISDVYDKIRTTNELITTARKLSYAYTYTMFNELHDELIERTGNLESYIESGYDSAIAYSYAYTSELIDALTASTVSRFDDVNSLIEQLQTTTSTNIDYSYAYSYSLFNKLSDDTDNKLQSLQSYVDDLNTYFTNLINDIRDAHDTDILNVLSYIPSYIAGFAITINDNNEISVDTSAIADNNTIYVNERGQLVVNKEVVLFDAERTFTFINERGEWVGDMANVKNYIDNSVSELGDELSARITYNSNEISYLRDDMNIEVTNIYSYVTKFTEYDSFGKNYELSETFIHAQE